MTNNRVRVGSWYAYTPTVLDTIQPPVGNPSKGEIVKVINLIGCPKANTMGMCYIQDGHGNFMGMCCTNSLHLMRKRGGHWYMVEEK